MTRTLLLAGTVTVLVVAVFHVLRRGKIASQDAYPHGEKHWNDRRFGIVNAITWISVFLAFQVMPRMGRMELSIISVAVTRRRLDAEC